MRGGGRHPRALVVGVGTRPEAVKMAPVIRALEERTGEVECRILLTGQHATLARESLAGFGITPHHDLAVMEEGQSLPALGARLLEGLERFGR